MGEETFSLLTAGERGLEGMDSRLTQPPDSNILPDRKPQTNFDPRRVEYLYEFLSGSIMGRISPEIAHPKNSYASYMSATKSKAAAIALTDAELIAIFAVTRTRATRNVQ